jgi:tetrapyrrole methylase family protein/MazG family protein
VARTQPALMEAQEISRKAVGAGFEWDTVDEVWAQVRSEVAEFEAAAPRSAEAEEEFGDVLFSLVNVARKEHLDAETCLRRSCDKFRRRWEAMEAAAWKAGKKIDDYTTAELNDLWNEAKKQVG